MRPLYSSVDVSGNVNSGKENENADDDMDSLFGDEDEDEKQDAGNEPVETGMVLMVKRTKNRYLKNL